MLVYSNGSHRSRGSHSIALMVGNLTEDGRVVGVGCCLITLSALSAPIYQSSYRFNEKIICENLWQKKTPISSIKNPLTPIFLPPISYHS